jgi:hypothetical protein
MSIYVCDFCFLFWIGHDFVCAVSSVLRLPGGTAGQPPGYASFANQSADALVTGVAVA